MIEFNIKTLLTSEYEDSIFPEDEQPNYQQLFNNFFQNCELNDEIPSFIYFKDEEEEQPSELFVIKNEKDDEPVEIFPIPIEVPKTTNLPDVSQTNTPNTPLLQALPNSYTPKFLDNATEADKSSHFNSNIDNLEIFNLLGKPSKKLIIEIGLKYNEYFKKQIFHNILPKFGRAHKRNRTLAIWFFEDIKQFVIPWLINMKYIDSNKSELLL